MKKPYGCGLSLLLCLLAPTVAFSQSAVTAVNVVADTAEYAALTSLYRATTGTSWLRNEHWLQGTSQEEMQNWQGVTFSQGDVQQLNLTANKLNGSLPNAVGKLRALKQLQIADNSLQGAVPFSLTQLQQLQQLELQDNAFTSLPDFSLHKKPAQLHVNVAGNHLDFGDLEPNFRAAGKPIFGEFIYTNQAHLGEAKHYKQREGTLLALEVVTGGTHNRYQWQKQRSEGSWQNLQGATAAKLRLEPLTLKDAGNYRCEITNAWVAGLTLTTQLYQLEVEEFKQISFYIDAQHLDPKVHYRLQTDTIDAVLTFGTIQKITLANPKDTLRVLMSLQDAKGKSLNTGFFFKIGPKGTISNLNRVNGMEKYALNPALYRLDSNYLQLLPLQEPASNKLHYSLNLREGLFFSPGGNAQHDHLVVKGLPATFTAYTFQVTTPNGTVVFSSQDPAASWDGRLASQANAPTGVYYYQLKVDEKEIKGQFILTR